MAQQWYVVHTYSGYENRAKQNLEERIKNLGKGRVLFRDSRPYGNRRGIRQGKKKNIPKEDLPWIYAGEDGIERGDLAYRQGYP